LLALHRNHLRELSSRPYWILFSSSEGSIFFEKIHINFPNEAYFLYLFNTLIQRIN
jgi:hypothetical protein